MPVEPSPPGPLRRGLRALHRVEDGLLIGVLAVMALLAPAQIALRAGFSVAVPWGDPLLRVLVLWVGLLGALVATRQDRHISVDVLTRLLPPRAAEASRALTRLFASGVAALLAYHGARFVAMDWQAGAAAFAGVPAWVCELILPVGFAVIACRYALRAVLHLRAAVSGDPR
ncbi:MAG: hypothetical protein Kow0092_35380 [Deferrisomatales bacterium]